MDLFESISPLDFRYYGRSKEAMEKLSPYLSEAAAIRYQLRIEIALVKVLAKRKICPKNAMDEVEKAAKKVTAADVYAEEDRIKHNIRALVNILRRSLPENIKPYIHLGATSHDIICSAESLRFKEYTTDVMIPALLQLQKTLINLAITHKSVLQIGRTHGQHAEPTTFGFAIAEYVSRLGTRIQSLQKSAQNLRGQMSGAVGAYNAISLFFSDPLQFEKEVLECVGLLPATHSTQIVEPEYMADFLHSVVSTLGVLANLADDMRHLQRSEIAEIKEQYQEKQVGSSTMPHKRNPINFENVKSLYKAFMPRMVTVYLDQVSEHQRDLTNSASSRFTPELLAALWIATTRMNKTMEKITVDEFSLKKNFMQNAALIGAEPLYILLAFHGHPDAHEYVRMLSAKVHETKKSLFQLFTSDPTTASIRKKFTKEQLTIIERPEQYIGKSVEKTEVVCAYWKRELKL